MAHREHHARYRLRQMGGAGQDLAIVKLMITAHGGQIIVKSKEGHGSVFRVELPLVNGNK